MQILKGRGGGGMLNICIWIKLVFVGRVAVSFFHYPSSIQRFAGIIYRDHKKQLPCYFHIFVFTTLTMQKVYLYNKFIHGLFNAEKREKAQM